jgi:hypothetical protein
MPVRLDSKVNQIAAAHRIQPIESVLTIQESLISACIKVLTQVVIPDAGRAIASADLVLAR